MRRQVLSAVFVLGIGQFTLSQTTCQDPYCGSSSLSAVPASSSYSQQQSSLPSSPHSPKTSAQCVAYRKQLDDQLAQIAEEHSACLDTYKADRQGDYKLICSRSECQTLHTYLYGDLKDQGDQQVANCEAAVQRYQARVAAQQQGIQTLGNTLSNLLAPSSSTPIDSQNDLATYEEQQKGQSVLGDDSPSASSTDSAAVNVMSSRVPDSGPLVQSQLDSAMDNALAGNSSTPASPIPTPPPTQETDAGLPSPVPGPLPPPDPSLATYTGLNINPQVLKGALQIARGCAEALIAAACAPAVETGFGAVVVAFGVQGAATDLAVGTVNIISWFSGDSTIGEHGQQVGEAMRNPFGQAGSLTGNRNTGKTFANIGDGIMTLGTLSQGTFSDLRIPGHPGLSLFNADQSGTSVGDAITSTQSSFPSSPSVQSSPSPIPIPPNTMNGAPVP